MCMTLPPSLHHYFPYHRRRVWSSGRMVRGTEEALCQCGTSFRRLGKCDVIDVGRDDDDSDEYKNEYGNDVDNDEDVVRLHSGPSIEEESC